MKNQPQNDLFHFFDYAQKHLSESESINLQNEILKLVRVTNLEPKIEPTISPIKFKILIDNDTIFSGVFESLFKHSKYQALVESFEVDRRHHIV